ncbi:MAG: 23S rRNA (guanosine(2251)-2'-O)-methyltransferase RlmB [Clostridia bacterium]|nr:23S rRNA (guanosine(2251)-2'-O)-methyltransferase RlmB [Clostridia bacterium]
MDDDSVVSGRNAVSELLESERSIEKIYIRRGDREGSVNKIIAVARERKIPIHEVDRERLDTMCAHNRHQGVVAIASPREYSSVEDILLYAESRGERPLIVICDGVEDPHNLGAIIRNAECAGAHGVIIQKRRSVGITPVVVKASAGAIEHMLVAKVTNISQTIDALKERGVWIYAADMGGASYSDTDMTSAAAIVLGSEGFGISRLVKEKCDFTVSIPLYGSINSMNVSAAAAVILSEAARQRHLAEV